MTKGNNNLIDNETRSRFGNLTDSEIEKFYEEGKKLQEKERKVKIYSDTLNIARVLRAFGYEGVKDLLQVSRLEVQDILEITNAFDYLRELDFQRRDSIILLSAPEPQHKKTVSARKKTSKQLSDILEQFKIEEV